MRGEKSGTALGICEGNERSFPSQEFEVIVEPGHGDQGTVHMMTSQKETYVPFQHRRIRHQRRRHS